MADIITAFPFTLTNDTPNDASQVMADLNHIRTSVNNMPTPEAETPTVTATGSSSFSLALPAEAAPFLFTLENTTASVMTGYLTLVIIAGYTGAAAGLVPHANHNGQPTSSNLDATYDNGTLGVGATLTANNNESFSNGSLGQRVVINGQTAQEENGVYDITDEGSGATPWILTRVTDFDTSGEMILGAYFCDNFSSFPYVFLGSNPVVGTDPIIFVQATGFSQASYFDMAANSGELMYQSISNGKRIDLASTVFGIAIASSASTPSFNGVSITAKIAYIDLST